MLLENYYITSESERTALIPKIIHYCWFGRNSKPKLAEKCIKSWKKYCPDYEIIEWNEDNYNISAAPLYVRQAYEAKKWAFVTDYVRLQVIYDYGGLYFDTDVEVVKNTDAFLQNQAFFGFQEGGFVNTGLGFGAEKGAGILWEIMQQYQSIPFILPDGSYDDLSCPERNTEVFLRHGLKANNKDQILDGNIRIYPEEVFSPIQFSTGIMRKTKRTATIHWFAGSWMSSEKLKWRDEMRKTLNKERRKNKLRNILYGTVKRLLGSDSYEILKKLLKRD